MIKASAEKVAFRFLTRESNTWDHPVFGNLKWNPSIGSWETSVRIWGNPVDLLVQGRKRSHNPRRFDTTEAERTYEAMLSGEPRFRMMSALENIDLYNSEWKEEGSPELTPKELGERWVLNTIVVSETGIGELWYDSMGTFTDHGIMIRFRKGGRYDGSDIA